jgi:branched-chain amino acid transport system ATP-binding protein
MSSSAVPEPVIAAANLTSGYGELVVLRDVSIVVRAGEVVSLLGPNGAGKSTLMMTLAGELPYSAGTVSWLGQATRSRLHQRARQGLSYVPERRSIISSLSAADNLRLGPGGIDPAVAVFPELRPLLARPAGLLSGGEQQILAMGRAFAAAPKALLVDELSLGLSPAVTVRLMSAVRRAASAAGVAVLLVEQQIVRAFEICDRWHVLRRGRIVASGTRSDPLESVQRAYFGQD